MISLLNTYLGDTMPDSRAGDYLNQFERDDCSALLYALSIKGGYYTHGGAIVQDIAKAKLFQTKDEAIAFRKQFDSWNQVSESILLAVALLIEELDDLDDAD